VSIKRITPKRSGVFGDAFLFYNFPIGEADANVGSTKENLKMLKELRASIYQLRQPTTKDPTSRNKWSQGKLNPDEAPVVGQIKVVGYTDHVSFKERAREAGKINYRLRVKRANTIKTYLETKFKSESEKMGPVSVIVEFPDSNFIIKGKRDPISRAQNRSVLVWVLPQAKAQKPVTCGESGKIAAEIKKRAEKDNDKIGMLTSNIMKMFCLNICSRANIDGKFLSRNSVMVYIQSEARKKKPGEVSDSANRDAFHEINEIILENRADKEAAYKKIRKVTEHIMIGYQEIGRYVNIYTGIDYRGGWLEKIITGKRVGSLPPHIEKLVLWITARIKGASVYQAFSKQK
jgi:hypothetical protein